MNRILTFFAGAVLAAFLIVGFRAAFKLPLPTDVGEISPTSDLPPQGDDNVADDQTLRSAAEAQPLLQPLPTNIPAASAVPAPGSDGADLSGDEYMPGVEIEREPFDPDWAPAMQTQVRNYFQGFLQQSPELSQRYSLATVRCRSTICEAFFLDYSPDPDVFDSKRPLSLRNMNLWEQPWADQFDLLKTTSIIGTSNGYLEYRLYLTRKQADDAI